MKISQSMVIGVLVVVVCVFCGYEIGKRTVDDPSGNTPNGRYQFRVIQNEGRVRPVFIFDARTGRTLVYNQPVYSDFEDGKPVTQNLTPTHILEVPK